MGDGGVVVVVVCRYCRQRWRWEDDGVGQEMEVGKRARRTLRQGLPGGRGEAVVAAAWLSR
jgi:hypothetical protein